MAKVKDPETTAANKKRRQTNLIEWKPGQSGNPNGRPKKGQSWAEIIRELGDMTPLAASDKCISIARELRKLGGEATLKELVVLRCYVQMLMEPQPSMLVALMNRADGMIPQQLQHVGEDGEATRMQVFDHGTFTAALTGRSAQHSNGNGAH